MTSTNPSSNIAIFDFDDTLIEGDSFGMFACHCRGKWNYLAAILRSSPWLMGWKLGLVSAGKAKEKLFGALFKAIHIEVFNQSCETFVNILNSRMNRSAIARLQDYTSAGTEVIIASASVSNWILPWARQFGIENVIATEVVVDKKGVISGKFKDGNCKGEEKLRAIKQRFIDTGNRHIVAFGNIPDDLPLLQYANESYVVGHRMIKKFSKNF